MTFGKLRSSTFKGERWVIALFTLAGICIWVLDAAVDSIVFSHGSFSELIFNASTHDFYLHTLFLIGFVVAGIFISGLMARRREDAEALREAFERAEDEKSKTSAIIAALGDGISIQSTDFRVLYQNSIHEELAGGSKAGQFCYKAYAGNDTVCPGCPVDKSFREGGIHRFEKNTPAAKGLRHIEIVASPLKDSSGRVVAGIEMVRDITDRKETGNKLKEAYSRLEALIEAIPYAVYFKDADGRHVVVNEACCDFSGHAKEELLGKTCDQLLPPELAEACRRSDEEIIRAGKTIRIDEQMTDGDGNKMFLETIKTPLFDESGNVQGLVGLSHDITWRKRIEEEFRKKEEMFSQMAENIKEVFWLFDCTEQKVLYASPAYEEIWGRPVQDLYDRYEEWGESIHPEDKELAGKSFLRIMETGGGEDRYYRIIRPDGTVRWISDKGYAIYGEDGKVHRVAGTAEDITERRDAEDKLREYRGLLEEMVNERTAELTSAVELLQEQIEDGYRSQQFIMNILESIDESLIVLDPEYRIVTANRAFCEHSGITLEKVRGMHCYEILHQRQHPCFVAGENCSARKVFVSGEPASSMHAHSRNGVSIFVETKTYPMRNSEGKVTSVIQVINDVTEKRRLEEQLRHSQKMEAIGQLAGGVAHDFNNRLAAIMNYAYIVKTKLGPDDPMLVHVNQILSSSERAAHLTQNLLTFSRKHVIDPRPMRLNDIVSRVEKLLARVIGEDIELRTEISSDELVVMADGDQVEHVLINLATNARDAMPGSGQVTIRTARVELGRQFFEGRRTSRPGSYAMIAFRDSGTGMDSKTREKVFEPFFTTKGVGKGTGLGLSIVYGIVRQHNGYITVESSPGRGTSFYVYLPLLAARVEQYDSEEAPPPDRGSETVLLVEDDEDVRKPVRQMLESYGYEVIEAVNGKDAVEKFLQSRKKIGLLMLDVILPGLNGFEVLAEIKKIEPGIRAIFTSGYSEEQIRSKGLVAAGATFLSKPVLPEVLLQRVREALDR